MCVRDLYGASCRTATRSLLVRVGAAFRPTFDDAHETSVVDEAFLGAPCEHFLLLCLCDLWRLILHLSSTRQTAVYLAHGETGSCSLTALATLEPKWLRIILDRHSTYANRRQVIFGQTTGRTDGGRATTTGRTRTNGQRTYDEDDGTDAGMDGRTEDDDCNDGTNRRYI